MKQSSRIIFGLLLATIVLHSIVSASEDLNPTEVVESKDELSPEDHHRSKRSPYDPLIPALLLGKSAFLLGTVLGPQLFHRPYPHRQRNYHRSFHGHGGGYGHGGHGGYGHHGGYSRGWGWK